MTTPSNGRVWKIGDKLDNGFEIGAANRVGIELRLTYAGNTYGGEGKADIAHPVQLAHALSTLTNSVFSQLFPGLVTPPPDMIMERMDKPEDSSNEGEGDGADR